MDTWLSDTINKSLLTIQQGKGQEIYKAIKPYL